MRRTLPWMRVVTLAAIFASAPACAGRGRPVHLRPTWIDAPSSADTPGRLTGVGSGSTREQAERAALAALAGRLVARVESSSYMARSDVQVGQGSELSARSDIVAERLAVVSSDIELIGARIDQIVTEPEQERVYALASLEVEPARSAHLAKAEAALVRAEENLELGLAASYVLNPPPAMASALRNSAESVEDFAIAGALRPLSEGETAGLARAAFIRASAADLLPQMLTEIGVILAPTRSTPDGVLNAAREAVDSFGATLASANDRSAAIRFVLELRVEIVQSFDPRQALRRWVLTLDVRNRAGGSLERRTYEGIVTALDADRAERRARADAVRKTREEAERILRAAILGEP